jgi:hypothetical protein
MMKLNYLITSAILSVAFCSLSAVSAGAAPGNNSRHGSSSSPANKPDEIQVPAKTEPGTAKANPQTVGLVKSYEDGNLELRLADGTSQKYQIAPEVAGSTDIRQGSFVSLGMNEKGGVKSLETAEVDKVYNGTINKIEDDKVTMELEEGGSYTTTIAPTTLTRMGLAMGSPLKVTTYRGTAATRLCMGQKATPVAAPPPAAAPVPAATTPPPEPIGGGEIEPAPALPPQPRALW